MVFLIKPFLWSAYFHLRPQTIENMRVKDETMVTADDEEVAADEEQDEFSGRV